MTEEFDTFAALTPVAIIGIRPEPDDTVSTVRGVGGRGIVYSRQVDMLMIDDWTAEGWSIEIGTMDYGFQIAGIIGMDLLKASGAVIDLGAHLADLAGLVEVKGGKTRLLPVRERMRGLFGKEGVAVATTARKGKRQQMALFEAPASVEADHDSGGAHDLQGTPGASTLDRVHQAMLLFAFGQGEQARRFLVDDGVGADNRFWRLVQALSALYPAQSEEKRWVDGILARKKALGFG